jgi:hypothetical protein
MKDMTQHNDEPSVETENSSPNLGKVSKTKNSSILVDIITFVLVIGAMALWVEYRVDSMVEAGIANHISSTPHEKIAVLDYSEIQDAFSSQMQKGDVESFILAKKDQIEALIKKGYVVLDGNTVVGAPQSSQYVVKP